MNRDPKIVQNIIREIIQVARDNPDMSLDRVLLEAEEKTSALFKSLTPSEEAPKPKSRKRAARHDRQNHVGRFFLYLIKKDLLNAKVQDYLIPIFAKSTFGKDSPPTEFRGKERVRLQPDHGQQTRKGNRQRYHGSLS